MMPIGLVSTKPAAPAPPARSAARRVHRVLPLPLLIMFLPEFADWAAAPPFRKGGRSPRPPRTRPRLLRRDLQLVEGRQHLVVQRGDRLAIGRHLVDVVVDDVQQRAELAD